MHPFRLFTSPYGLIALMLVGALLCTGAMSVLAALAAMPSSPVSARCATLHDMTPAEREVCSGEFQRAE